MEQEFYWSQSGVYQIRVAGTKEAYVLAHRLDTSSAWQAGLPPGVECEDLIGWAEYLERKQREDQQSVAPFPVASGGFREGDAEAQRLIGEAGGMPAG